MTTTSRVDPTVPASPIARTSSVRQNFSIIKAEIEKIFGILEQNLISNNPQFTGIMEGEAGLFSGNMRVNTLTVDSGDYSELSVLNDTVAAAMVVAVINQLNIVKITKKIWVITGAMNNSSGGAIAANGGVWATFPGTLNAASPQFVPMSLWNSNLEHDLAYCELRQNGTLIEMRPTVIEAAATQNVPNAAALLFNGIVLVQ